MRFSTVTYAATIAVGNALSVQTLPITTVAADLTKIASDIANVPFGLLSVPGDIIKLATDVPSFLTGLANPASIADPQGLVDNIVEDICPTLKTLTTTVSKVPEPFKTLFNSSVAQLRAQLVTVLNSLPATPVVDTSAARACLTSLTTRAIEERKRSGGATIGF